MIKAIIFDIGGVLIENPSPGLIAYCARALAVATDRFEAVHRQHLVESDFQKGAITEAAFWQMVCSDLGVPLPRASSLWGDAIAAVYTEQPDVFSLAMRLRRNQYLTSVLSNTEVPIMEYFLAHDRALFDALTFSCTEGFVKPQPEIYQRAVNKLNVSAAETIFIDDVPAYVAAAERVGLHGIRFESVGQVGRALQSFGVNIL